MEELNDDADFNLLTLFVYSINNFKFLEYWKEKKKNSPNIKFIFKQLRI